MMPLPQTVVFDLGKVLVDFDYSIAARRIAARGAMSALEVQKFIDHSPLLFRYETGLMTKDEFFRDVSAATGFRGDFAEFAHIFSDIFAPMNPMIELHARLHRQQVPMFIFSNTNELAIGHIRRNYPFFEHFNGYVFSYEHGSMKPHPKLYEVVERVTGCNGERILYVDDKLENAEAGRARGWQVIHHSDAQKTIAVFEKMNLVPARNNSPK